jgi:acyl-CoA synthetase (AMP-forming)/AMP-acid ligase II
MWLKSWMPKIRCSSFYTSGSTGKPKGMVHTTAGYMVYSAYTFKNVLIMKTMIFFGVLLILVGLPDIPIFFDRY